MPHPPVRCNSRFSGVRHQRVACYSWPMDVDGFMRAVRADPEYADQIVHVHEIPPRQGVFPPLPVPLADRYNACLTAAGIERLYCHQIEALQALARGRDVLVVTGAASGKSLCYRLPILDMLGCDPSGRALLLFPTKALGQDQFQQFRRLQDVLGIAAVTGVYDGDAPATVRRKLRDGGRVVFSNPDMVHAALMPQHARWSALLSKLRFIIIDELHVYNGMFGSSMALLLMRLLRLCRHYGANPQLVATSATIGNPAELARGLTGRDPVVVDRDGSPCGKRTYVFWNPPQCRHTRYRSRRSANVEAHELAARLVADDVPTIVFSKAKMTAEMIYRYICDRLRECAPAKVARVAPYRGGYLPEERRAIERRLFAGDLLGVSATRALELGIDVGSLEACIIVGYPGTRTSFFQQAGRAGRRERDAVVFLVGLDTSINQYIMTCPDFLFARAIECAVIAPTNPFVVLGQIRCAVHELPLDDGDVARFGPYTSLVLRVLEANRKIRHIDGKWYHAVNEVPQHDVSLRDVVGENVTITDVDTGAVIGEVNRYDAQSIVHPQAVYMHRGDTYLVTELDLDRNRCSVKRVDVDYNTQPHGSTDVHHIDHQLREKKLGNGHAYWGEVTAYFTTYAFEKVHFYSLDAISVHGLELPIEPLDTMAFWLVPDDWILERVKRAGLDAHSGLRAIGYATRMLLPLFIACDTLDYSHTIGSVNAPWQAVFVYERYPHGLGFTQQAYERLHEILPAVLRHLAACPCEAGCPCCVGKPLRQYSVWNVERGEASIPSKAAALMILRGLLDEPTADRPQPDAERAIDTPFGDERRLEQALQRRLEVMANPRVLHPISPRAAVQTAYPDLDAAPASATADVAQRAQRRLAFDRELHKRIAKRVDIGGLKPDTAAPSPPGGMKRKGSNLPPTAFPGRPDARAVPPPDPVVHPPASESPPRTSAGPGVVQLGDALAARARRDVKRRLRD